MAVREYGALESVASQDVSSRGVIADSKKDRVLMMKGTEDNGKKRVFVQRGIC